MTDILVDTNILVYAYDRSESVKQKRAVEVLELLVRENSGFFSTQTLAEFFNAVTRKITTPLTVDKAFDCVQNYLVAWPVLEVTGSIVLEAARGVLQHQLNYWDSQLWATARLNQIPMIYSEDFQDGMFLEGVRFINPLLQ